MFLANNSMSIAMFSHATLTLILGILQRIAYGTFLTLRRNAIIKKRFPEIIQLQVRVLTLLLTCTIPLAYYNKAVLLSQVPDYGEYGSEDIRELWIVHRVQIYIDVALLWIVNPMLIFLLSHLEAMRQYLMFYQLKLLHSALFGDWHKMISSSWTKHWKHEFYQKHCATLGNAKWLKKRVLAYWLLVSTAASSFAYHVVTNTVRAQMLWPAAY